jgi:hypothetical protein
MNYKRKLPAGGWRLSACCFELYCDWESLEAAS